MSLAWIKVDREKKTHSIYSDGLEITGTAVACHDNSKISVSKIDVFSVLMGLTGASYSCEYIQKYLPIKLRTNGILYGIDTNKDIKRDFSELLEELDNDFNEKYGEHMDNSIILSINGRLFNIYQYDKRWMCIHTNETFICTGAVEKAAKALLTYDENIEPQKMLDTLSKVNTTINNNLFKFENISYE